MFEQDLFFDMFIALFALLNPLYAIPVFLGMTADYSGPLRQKTAAIAVLTTFIALVVAALIGDQILNLFGIHLPSFQIAGGLIVLMIALAMLKGENEEGEQAEQAVKEQKEKPAKSIAVYPLAIPLLAGPGVFVTTIVFSSRVESMGGLLAAVSAIISVVCILWLSMAFATTASRFLNKTAINIGTKVLGILLAAVSVEMILAGLDAHFIPLLSKF